MCNNLRHKVVKIYPSVRGFSMIELLATLAISSILMTVAAPSMLGFYQQYTVTSQANELVNALTQARSEAIRRNTPIRFCRASSESALSCASNTGEWEYWLLLANNAVVNRGLIRNTGGLKQTANFQSLTFGADGLAYNNQQLLASAYIQLKAGSNIRCVNLSSSRRTHVTKPVSEQNNHNDDDDDDDEDDDDHDDNLGSGCS
ncbi:MAG: prepilin-type N-terminal cleavage/methylation domain-containing protein [Thiothrix sp.]|nr:MAG: prepilin-type N-terminal cleavage/methylation domain-containing protein [Thiothrix sp.]